MEVTQIEARFTQHEERMRRMETEISELRQGVVALRTALEGNPALGIVGIVKMVSDTYEIVNKAKWMLIGAAAVGGGFGAGVAKLLGQ